MDGFYILDLGTARLDSMLWWKPENRGYTTQLNKAGIYSAETVKANESYYNNGDETLAVPCDVAQRFAIRVVPGGGSELQELRAQCGEARSIES